MKAKHDNKPLPAKYTDDKALTDLEGYPLYPDGEDIFNQNAEEWDMNPEVITETKSVNAVAANHNKLNESDDVSGDDLDVPGSELDDDLENVGSEDEENNYYSLGGDDHNDLDEDKA